jgi:hypothetical protein
MPRCRVALADLDRPPDTSVLIPCDDSESAHAVDTVRARLLRRRKTLLDKRDRGGELDKILAGLRRLHNPYLAAYRTGQSILLSEPFNAIKTSLAPAPADVASKLVRSMFVGVPPARIVRALGAFGQAALTKAVDAGVRISIVPDQRRYAEFSPAVARLVPSIDDWSAPPSGLFVVEERRVLLRSRAMAMTAAHEFAHALDAVLAQRPRSYFSYESEELRCCFATATGFVNEYAASGLDEYFAESVRAYLEINDARCAWLPLTRRDLFQRDRRMFALVDRLFATGFDQFSDSLVGEAASAPRTVLGNM